MKDIAVRKRILEATINSIEQFGIESCTIRNIAKEGGVTLSSIHYYFESKEDLVNAALNQAISGSFEDINNLWQEHDNKKTALQAILMFLFEGAIRYPGITRAGLYPLLMQGATDGLFIVSLNAFLAKISDELAQQFMIDKDRLALEIIQAFSTVMFLGISADAYKSFSSVSFLDAAHRQRLVENLTAGLL